jgi:aminomethyltransferase
MPIRCRACIRNTSIRTWVPLVEVVQDTVGRHDAFAMACASKYYDDIGYPGHVNCSDNFNKALARHAGSIRGPAGWR